jgi:hypothetical protein
MGEGPHREKYIDDKIQDDYRKEKRMGIEQKLVFFSNLSLSSVSV